MILIRAEEDVIQNFKKSVSENKVSTYAEGLKCLVTYAGSEVFQEYQDCKRFGEYPLDSKHFIQCIDPKSGKKVIRKREDCQACAHNRVIKVLMESKAKLEQEDSELEQKYSERQHRLGDLNTDIVRKTKELEKIENFLTMPERLQKKDKEIADLKVALKENQKNIEYLDQACTEMKERCEGLQRQVEPLQTVPRNVLDVVQKRVSEQKPPIAAAAAQKVEASKPAQTIQRVTEREKTEKERIVETVTSDPFTNKEIQCPQTGKYVDITKECNKACSDIFQCPYWQEINKGTVPLGAEIRLRQG